jgi:hypothetical protein
VLLIDYSLGRLDAALEEINRIEDSEFPYDQSHEALGRIRDLFKDCRKRIVQLPSDKALDIVKAMCGEVLTTLFRYLPLIGFILRSTNVRNAFELYGPLLRLARQIVSPTTKLVLSSEWRMYSPFTYLRIPALPEFVLIGFPAPESANPLLLPLAGHELGHTVWGTRAFGTQYRQQIEQHVINGVETNFQEYNRLFGSDNLIAGEAQNNIFVRRRIAVPAAWALRQAEEYFCDFLGLALFDKAYLHAFAYLVSPAPAGERAVFYPNTIRRIDALLTAADVFKEKAPDAYVAEEGFRREFRELFQDQSDPAPAEREKRFFVALADSAADSVVARLISDAEKVRLDSAIPPLAVQAKTDVLNSFKFEVPAQQATLSSVVNAAWDAYHDATFWPDATADQKNHTLKELALKTIEVIEIEQITKPSE